MNTPPRASHWDRPSRLGSGGGTLPERPRSPRGPWGPSGPDSPDTLASANDLAGAYQAAGDLGRALPLYEQTLADCRRILGEEHSLTKTVRENLAAAAP